MGQRLLDAANKREFSSKYVTVKPDRRCSLPATSNQKPKETSFARRRASLDDSILSSPRSRNDGCPPTPKHRQPSITSTISRTPRTSPSLSRSQHRKYHDSDDSAMVMTESPHQTPTSTRNLSAAAAACLNNYSDNYNNNANQAGTTSLLI